MHKNRVEAFSDAVIAIIITIMVLELKVPHTTALEGLIGLVPVFFSYVLSFIYVGIYWNNHHHLFQAVHSVNGRALWGNLHLLFWLSLLPFVTGWMGENHYALYPVALYGFVLFMAAVAYYILVQTLTCDPTRNPDVKNALGSKTKEMCSMAGYLLGIGLSFVSPVCGLVVYTGLAALWLIPDSRIERNLRDKN
ncbi:MAG: hypothetical protein DI551_02765 [Micavibrio aeruginosavorus]|uniref:DUF1211 domain-containing protein n=1 Tax=Micavibrio aeruginosavorus TaxID=349221 RepID=A0A2W5N2L1_9BACT|nr:MAG: hypothetical protein DI551_02765 [Micavibrio aeruginosavorus]